MENRHPGMLGGRPVSASIIRYPGVPALPKDTERYRCKGGGSLVVRVEAGDLVTVTDAEGGQACELSFVDESGRFQAAGLGAAFTNAAEGLKTILSREEAGTLRIRSALRRRGADLATAGALRIFGERSTPGSRVEFTIALKGLLIVAAPAEAMSPEAQDTATPIEVRVRRSRVVRDYSSALPEPLADPIEDIRIRLQPLRRISCGPENSYRSSTSMAASARTFRPLPPARSTRASTWLSTQPSPVPCSGAATRAGPALQGFRSRFRAAGGDRAGHGWPSRRFRHRLQFALLR